MRLRNTVWIFRFSHEFHIAFLFSIAWGGSAGLSLSSKANSDYGVACTFVVDLFSVRMAACCTAYMHDDMQLCGRKDTCKLAESDYEKGNSSFLRGGDGSFSVLCEKEWNCDR